jgi:hypothetical protein
MKLMRVCYYWYVFIEINYALVAYLSIEEILLSIYMKRSIDFISSVKIKINFNQINLLLYFLFYCKMYLINYTLLSL